MLEHGRDLRGIRWPGQREQRRRKRQCPLKIFLSAKNLYKDVKSDAKDDGLLIACTVFGGGGGGGGGGGIRFEEQLAVVEERGIEGLSGVSAADDERGARVEER